MFSLDPIGTPSAGIVNQYSFDEEPSLHGGDMESFCEGFTVTRCDRLASTLVFHANEKSRCSTNSGQTNEGDRGSSVQFTDVEIESLMGSGNL